MTNLTFQKCAKRRPYVAFPNNALALLPTDFYTLWETLPRTAQQSIRAILPAAHVALPQAGASDRPISAAGGRER